MKIFKYLACGLLLTGAMSALVACSDDDACLEAPRLFSPVISVSANSNSIECKWQGIAGATSYRLTLLKATALTDEDGNVITSEVKTVDVAVDPEGIMHFSPYVFEDLGWDERYKVNIQAIGENKESHVYSSDFVSVNYPTKLKTVSSVIDTSVRIDWNAEEGTQTDLAYFNVYTINEDGSASIYLGPNASADKSREGEEGDAEEEEEPVEEPGIVYDVPEPNDAYYYSITVNDLRNGYLVIDGLEALTSYRVVAYDRNGEYRGRRDFKTQAPEEYEHPELVFDLRNIPDEVADTIFKGEFFNDLPENAIVILKGGRTYEGSPTVTKSIKIMTGASLAGKATIATGGFTTQNDITFTLENVKFQCLPTDNLSSNFGGRYLFNHSNVATVDLYMENVDVKYMRGFVRTRKDGQVYNVYINNCTLDSIGGYGVVQCDNANTYIDNFVMTNSTLSHANRVLRTSKDNTGFKNVKIENCTFAYVGEGQYFFDFGNSDLQNPELNFSMKDCIVAGNENDKSASGFRCKNGMNSFTNVYIATDFAWSLDNSGNPVGAFGDTMESTKLADIWKDPLSLDFTLKSNKLPCSQAGDPRWHVVD